MAPENLDRNPVTADAVQSSHPGILRLMLRPSAVRTGLQVSLVIGSVLNVINNGEQFWTTHTVTLWRVALNYIVPYCVSSYSAARGMAQRSRSD